MTKKPGRPQSGEFNGPKIVLSTRVTNQIRDQLTEEADATGETISTIVERRLRQSYGQKGGVLDRAFGTGETRALSAIFGKLAASVEMTTGEAWRTSPFSARVLQASVQLLLARLMPPGKPEVPERIRQNLESAPFLRKYLEDPDAMAVSIVEGLIQSLYMQTETPLPKRGKAYADGHYQMPQIRAALNLDDLFFQKKKPFQKEGKK